MKWLSLPNKTTLGWNLIVLSGVPWALMFAVPWMSLETGIDSSVSESIGTTSYSILLAGFLYALSQVMWIIGLWCVGRDGVSQIKSHIFNHKTVQAVLLRLGIVDKNGQQSS